MCKFELFYFTFLEERQEGQIIRTKMEKKRSSGFFILPKAHVAAGIQRLIKGIKSFSQLFCEFITTSTLFYLQFFVVELEIMCIFFL